MCGHSSVTARCCGEAFHKTTKSFGEEQIVRHAARLSRRPSHNAAKWSKAFLSLKPKKKQQPQPIHQFFIICRGTSIWNTHWNTIFFRHTHRATWWSLSCASSTSNQSKRGLFESRHTKPDPSSPTRDGASSSSVNLLDTSLLYKMAVGSHLHIYHQTWREVIKCVSAAKYETHLELHICKKLFCAREQMKEVSVDFLFPIMTPVSNLEEAL